MSLEQKVMEIIKNNREKKYEVTLESDLLADLEIDSFDKLMILSALEDEFGITVDEDDFSQIRIVNDIVVSLRERYPQIEGQ